VSVSALSRTGPETPALGVETRRDRNRFDQSALAGAVLADEHRDLVRESQRQRANSGETKGIAVRRRLRFQADLAQSHDAMLARLDGAAGDCRRTPGP